MIFFKSTEQNPDLSERKVDSNDSNGVIFSSYIQVVQHKITSVRRRLLEYSDITQLISERRFTILNDIILQSGTTQFKNEYQKMMKLQFMRFQNQPSIVHYLCMFQPPLSTVKLLTNSDYDSLSIPNKEGWCPLHVACYHGASPEVIRYLVDINPESVKHLDNTSRNALHLAMGNEKINPKVVNILVTSYPFIVKQEDNFGSTALEEALLDGKVGVRFVALLNKAMKKELDHQTSSIYSNNNCTASEHGQFRNDEPN